MKICTIFVPQFFPNAGYVHALTKWTPWLRVNVEGRNDLRNTRPCADDRITHTFMTARTYIMTALSHIMIALCFAAVVSSFEPGARTWGLLRLNSLNFLPPTIILPHKMVVTDIPI